MLLQCVSHFACMKSGVITLLLRKNCTVQYFGIALVFQNLFSLYIRIFASCFQFLNFDDFISQYM